MGNGSICVGYTRRAYPNNPSCYPAVAISIQLRYHFLHPLNGADKKLASSFSGHKLVPPCICHQIFFISQH